MLNIYYGSETVDKSKFVYENVKGRTILLVPDQYSLQAEKDAFYYLGKKSFMDIIVADFSSLGNKAVKEAGGRRPAMIDKYGRHMLLTKIISEIEEDLKVFRGQSWKNSFIDMVNSLISEMKRYGVSPEKLNETIEQIEGSNYLKLKLEDLSKIYSLYQEYIKDKYLDTEDYVDFYGEKIKDASIVKNAEIWIYGFDTFTPKNILIIQRLLKTAANVNIVMTYSEKTSDYHEDAAFLLAEDNDLYALTGYVIHILKQAAQEVGESTEVRQIGAELRKNVWSSNDLNAVTLVKTSSIYAEADRAAAYILSLVRDEGYKFGDIVVVCNDYELRGNLLRRTFLRWGIPVFADKKRKVMHNPAVGFLLALMEVLAKGYRDDAVMRMLKSGLMDLTADEIEKLENYVKEFRIRGNMWKKEFTKRGSKLGEKELEELNAQRIKVVECIETARQKLGARNSAMKKIQGMYFFLEEDFGIRERLEGVIKRQEEAGLVEAAAETAQSWNVICSIFDQIVETIEKERISNEELLKLMIAGFSEVEIGLVPASSDCVIIGTLQRTRLNRVKALLVVGANDGIIPMMMKDDGLLNDREKQTLQNMSLEICKRDDVVRQEERLAIYRTFSVPEDKLYVSCAIFNEKGEEIRPSGIFNALEEYKGGVIINDLGKGESYDEVVSKEGTLSYLADAVRNYYAGGKLDKKWLPVIKWYEENEPERLNKIKNGILFDNTISDLGADFAEKLYKGEREAIEVSASRLEGYSKCPFAHFIKYGLRAEEMTTYEMHASDIGTVYHECLMRISEKLTENCEGMAITDPESAWNKIQRQECAAMVRDIIDNEMADFREGLLTGRTAELYRTERLKEICTDIVWSMIRQVQQGKIKEMYFEQPFGRKKDLPPVKVNVGDQEVLIRGTIDRMDVLDNGGSEAVRIVDYKTGGDFIDPDYMRSGYKLQLMIYLAASQKEPAGVFYFKIKDVDVDADRVKVIYGEEALEERITSSYKLEGIMVNDSSLLEAMDGQISPSSDVIPVKYSKKENAYVAASGGHLMTKEDFTELYEEVGKQVNRICREICDGNISIAPKVEHTKDINGGLRVSCKYCDYKSICMFDTAFEGCRFQQV